MSRDMIGLRSFCALLALALMSQHVHARAAKPRPQNASSALANPLAALSLKRLSATQERPLFTPGRRRPAPPAAMAQVAPPPPEPPRLVVSAIIMASKETVAVVRPDAGGKTRRLHLKDEIDGWRVTQIDRQKLTITLGGRSASIPMFKSDKGSKAFAAGGHAGASILAANAAIPGGHPAHR